VVGRQCSNPVPLPLSIVESQLPHPRGASRPQADRNWTVTAAFFPRGERSNEQSGHPIPPPGPGAIGIELPIRRFAEFRFFLEPERRPWRVASQANRAPFAAAGGRARGERPHERTRFDFPRGWAGLRTLFSGRATGRGGNGLELQHPARRPGGE